MTHLISEVKKAGYLFPCTKNGNHGPAPWPFWVDEYGETRTGGQRYGMYSIRGEYDKLLYSYRCCTVCFKPVNQESATKVNAFLGNALEDETIDDDFLELLNGLF